MGLKLYCVIVDCGIPFHSTYNLNSFLNSNNNNNNWYDNIRRESSGTHEMRREVRKKFLWFLFCKKKLRFYELSFVESWVEFNLRLLCFVTILYVYRWCVNIVSGYYSIERSGKRKSLKFQEILLRVKSRTTLS